MISIFYSWQSDLSEQINRNFIENIIKKVIKDLNRDLSLQKAIRDESIVIDKDTKGIPGTPPIVETIFKKISECSIFIPDLTFAGKTELGRPIPNPNVLIEYGWALKAVGHSRIIPIMNAAFGEPSNQTLPFNMRHLRHPITYVLTDDMGTDKRLKIKAELIKELTHAIKLILEKRLLDMTIEETKIFQETQWTLNPSTFLEEGEAVASRQTRDGELILHIANVEHIFLRIIPSVPDQLIKNAKAAYDLSISGNLAPMDNQMSGYSRDRNRYGACVYEHDNGKVTNMTQLFKSGELWGIDAECIEKQRHMKFAGVNFGYFLSGRFERTFITTLTNYLQFASSTLKLSLPIRFIAGATGVKGYRMTAPSGMSFPGLEKFDGNVVENDIIYKGEITDYKSKPTEILRPFFDYVWEECGLIRPNQESLG